MEQFIQFIQERWLLTLIAIVGIFILMKIVKSMIKWLFIVAIVIALFVYGSNFIPA